MSDAGVILVWPVAASLGEGPMWDARTGRLWFVDIKQGRVHSHDPATGTGVSVDVGGLPCFVLPADDGGFVLGDGHCLRRFDGARVTGEIAQIAMPPSNRLNDATVDYRGRVWFGAMDNLEEALSGTVFVHDAGSIHEAGGECCITNGPAISRDGRWLFHVDTVAGLIWRFDITHSTMLREGTIFARIDPEHGHPDGVTIDAEDHLWVGLWGGWCARRYAPDGRCVQQVAFPVSNVTKLAFGDPDLRTAYVTTARQGLSASALEAQPLAGSLFSFRVETPGVLMPEAKL